jgi:hypothetical protein
MMHLNCKLKIVDQYEHKQVQHAFSLQWSLKPLAILNKEPQITIPYLSYTKAATSHEPKASFFSRRLDTDSSLISLSTNVFLEPYNHNVRAHCETKSKFNPYTCDHIIKVAHI